MPFAVRVLSAPKAEQWGERNARPGKQSHPCGTAVVSIVTDCARPTTTTVLNCAMGGLGWTLGKISLQKGWLGIGMGCQGSGRQPSRCRGAPRAQPAGEQREKRAGPRMPRDGHGAAAAAPGGRRFRHVSPGPLVAAATGTSPAPSGLAWRRLFRCGE